MRSRTFIAVAALLGVLVVAIAAGYLYDQSNSDVVAKGISVGGVDIGGKTADQARATLRAAYAERLDHPVTVTAGGRAFTLSPRQARVRVNIDAMVDEALRRSRDDVIFARIWRNLTGGEIAAAMQPQLSYSQPAVDRFVAAVARTVNRAPRDASVSFSTSSLGEVPGRTGTSVLTPRLRAEVAGAITAQRATGRFAVPVAVVHPKVTTADLAARYPTVVTISRGGFRLYLWKGLRLSKSYPIAVGRQGLETPAGLYTVNDKQVNPSWHVPNSAWAGSLAGQVIPPGPNDPIKARWIGIAGGAGIHGTEEVGSLGSAASHGCVRMSIPDVIDLYDRVPMGTPLYIA